MPRPSARGKLVEAALEQLHTRGFHNCSVEDITRAAGVPKGSFYNHFESKDALASEAIREYQSRSVWRRGGDEQDPPLERLRGRFAAQREIIETHGYARGCLIGNMASELSDFNEQIRAQVQDSLAFRTQAVAQMLREAQQRGELSPAYDPDLLGAFLINTWEGVTVRTKVCKSAEPIDGFFAVLDQLLAATPAHAATEAAR